MSRKKPITIEVKDTIEILPGGIFYSKVVPSGNGAVIKFYKKFIDKDVIVMVVDKIKRKNKDKLTKEDYMDLADFTDYSHMG